jgi:hypothetical protein
LLASRMASRIESTPTPQAARPQNFSVGKVHERRFGQAA